MTTKDKLIENKSEYIGSQEHFEDEVNAYYDAIENKKREQEKQGEQWQYRDTEHAITGN